MEAELLQRGRGEARRVALVAHEHDPAVVVGHLRYAVGTGGVETPLEHVAGNHDRAGELTVALTLLDRPDVDHDCSGGDLVRQPPGCHAHEPGAGVFEELVDRPPVHTGNATPRSRSMFSTRRLRAEVVAWQAC